jgi:hypothetical protein
MENKATIENKIKEYSDRYKMLLSKFTQLQNTMGILTEDMIRNMKQLKMLIAELEKENPRAKKIEKIADEVITEEVA